jgi:hypothetical protein
MPDISEMMSSFNAADYQEQPEYDNSPLPEGDYYLEVEAAIVKETANGKGAGANVTFTVLGEVNTKEHKGRKLFQWYTLHHENSLAQRIGQEQFHGLRIAVGDPTLNDTDLLLGKQIVASVGFDRKEPTRNVIKKCKPMEGYKAPAAQPSKPAAKPAAVSEGNPWD